MSALLYRGRPYARDACITRFLNISLQPVASCSWLHLRLHTPLPQSVQHPQTSSSLAELLGGVGVAQLAQLSSCSGMCSHKLPLAAYGPCTTVQQCSGAVLPSPLPSTPRRWPSELSPAPSLLHGSNGWLAHQPQATRPRVLSGLQTASHRHPLH